MLKIQFQGTVLELVEMLQKHSLVLDKMHCTFSADMAETFSLEERVKHAARPFWSEHRGECRKLDAIKAVRAATGMGLAEAKAAVELHFVWPTL
jgi:ribosomal protein L7/L12